MYANNAISQDLADYGTKLTATDLSAGIQSCTNWFLVLSVVLAVIDMADMYKEDEHSKDNPEVNVIDSWVDLMMKNLNLPS